MKNTANRVARGTYFVILALYTVVWFHEVSFRWAVRAPLFGKAVYGSKIEGNRYYFKINKDRQVYEEVAPQIYKSTIEAKKNAAIAIFEGLGGFVIIFLGGAGLGFIPKSQPKQQSRPIN